MRAFGKRKQDYLILTLILIVIIVGCICYQMYSNHITFEVTEEENCQTDKQLYYTGNDGQKYYTSCLKEIDVHFKNGEVLTLKDALKQGELTLKQLFSLADKKEELQEENTTLYYYSDFSIIYRTHDSDTDSVVNDIIFVPKDYRVGEEIYETYIEQATIEKEKVAEAEIILLAQKAIKKERQEIITNWDEPEVKIVQFQEEPALDEKEKDTSLVGMDLYQVTFSKADQEVLVVYLDCYDGTVYGMDYK